MNELDCVKLIKPFKNLKLGKKRCILLKYIENDEAMDDYTITKEYLEVYWTPKDGFLNKN